MTPSLRLQTSRLLLALMLLTFLSPSFGWQIVAGHELLERAAVAVEADHHHGHEHDHHDAAPTDASLTHEHEHEDAHSMIGHVLSHMPATIFSAPVPLPVPHQPVMLGAELLLVLPTSPPDQPYRPPQAVLA